MLKNASDFGVVQERRLRSVQKDLVELLDVSDSSLQYRKLVQRLVERGTKDGLLFGVRIARRDDVFELLDLVVDPLAPPLLDDAVRGLAVRAHQWEKKGYARDKGNRWIESLI